jgi:hypothetical protein
MRKMLFEQHIATQEHMQNLRQSHQEHVGNLMQIAAKIEAANQAAQLKQQSATEK